MVNCARIGSSERARLSVLAAVHRKDCARPAAGGRAKSPDGLVEPLFHQEDGAARQHEIQSTGTLRACAREVVGCRRAGIYAVAGVVGAANQLGEQRGLVACQSSFPGVQAHPFQFDRRLCGYYIA